MKKIVLFASAFFLTAAAGWAQTSYDSALSAAVGNNSYTVEGNSADSVFWKFTADKNYLATIGPLDGKYDQVTVTTIRANADTQKNDTIALVGAQAAYPNKIYPLKKGETYYMILNNVGELGFKFAVEEFDRLEGGVSADQPVNLQLDAQNYLGNAYRSGYSNYNAYARYTADKNGVLLLSSNAYFGTCTVNGSTTLSCSYENGGYVAKLTVEAGKTYDMAFNISNPVLITAKMTYPKEGSYEMPFSLAEGQNTVPAAYGEYYYTYTPAKTGYLTVSSENSLPGGSVKIYTSKENVQYGQVAAESETGSYNVRVEVPYLGSTYYIYVNKLDGTDEDETFTFKMEDYKAGEKESNPISLAELPATQTLATAKGTYYYSVTVPANTVKFLAVKSDVTNPAYGTQLAIYPVGGSSYNGATGSDFAKLNVTNSAETTYIIKVTSEEASPLTFQVYYEDILPGDVITNPVAAVLGDNTVTGNGTKYYTYTPTKDCKLVVSGTPEMTVSFPRGTGQLDGNYDAIVKGVDYTLEATAGKAYLIKLENVSSGDVFSLAEQDFVAGDTRSNPIVVEGDSYPLTGADAGNLWLKYVVKKDGVVTVDCDAPYDYNSIVEFGKETDSYLSGMVSTVTNGSNTNTVYRGQKNVKAGDAILVHLKMKSNVDNYKVTFAERDYQAGESLDNPLAIELGKTVNLPSVTRSTPVWCTVNLHKGTAQFKSDGYVSGMLYANKEDAARDVNGTYFSFQYDSSLEGTMNYSFSQSIAADGEYYIQFNDSYGQVNLTLFNDGTSTGINIANASAGSYSLAGGQIVARGQAKVSVFTLGGAKVATLRGGNAVVLKPGVYVVNADGKTNKVVVK